MKKIFVIAMIFASGCISIKYEPKIEVVKPYEGHYMTTNDFYKATSNMQLEEGESVWVLSNRTLKRVIKNVKEGK